MPQGINVGPALLQKDIDATCAPISDVAQAYFDDILVGTRREPGMTDLQLVANHVEDVKKLLGRLKADKWVADKAKARFLMSRV